MKWNAWLAAVAISMAGWAGAAELAKGKPNVVILLADDLGWNAVGYHGGYARTPNIDSIARKGVELDRFYVCPMCSPTREGLMTGRYPMRFGMGRSVVRPWSNAGIPSDELTMPQALGQAGYGDRAMFGKWHMGHLDPKYHPLAKGFTHFEGCYNGAADYFTRDREGQPDWHVDYEDKNPEGYTTDIIADAAAAYIREQGKAKTPFFCYVAFTAVHEPAQATQKYLDQYENLKGEKKILAAQDTCMDDGIGRIMGAIEKAGIRDNTLIWFFSDNGGIRKIPGNNAPLRGGKLTCYEGGIRTPAAVWWPGVIEGGRKLEAPVVNVDLMPTLLRIAGGTPVYPKKLDGMDVTDELTGTSEGKQRDVYSFTGQDGLEKEIISINSEDGWKLIVSGPDIRRGAGIEGHKVELFHLAEDPLEKTELAEKEPARVKALAAKLIAFRSSEPAGVSETPNGKPKEFVVPKNWHNGPGK